jgi:hypothetical protein
MCLLWADQTGYPLNWPVAAFVFSQVRLPAVLKKKDHVWK